MNFVFARSAFCRFSNLSHPGVHATILRLSSTAPKAGLMIWELGQDVMEDHISLLRTGEPACNFGRGSAHPQGQK